MRARDMAEKELHIMEGENIVKGYFVEAKHQTNNFELTYTPKSPRAQKQKTKSLTTGLVPRLHQTYSSSLQRPSPLNKINTHTPRESMSTLPRLQRLAKRLSKSERVSKTRFENK